MTVKYIKEDLVPLDAIRPRFRPEYHALWGDYDKIMPKYTDPAYTGVFTSVSTTVDNVPYSLQTSVLYFTSMDAMTAFKAETKAYLEKYVNPFIDESHFPGKQGIIRKYQIRNVDTNEVIVDWTPITE